MKEAYSNPIEAFLGYEPWRKGEGDLLVQKNTISSEKLTLEKIHDIESFQPSEDKVREGSSRARSPGKMIEGGDKGSLNTMTSSNDGHNFNFNEEMLGRELEYELMNDGLAHEQNIQQKQEVLRNQLNLSMIAEEVPKRE